MLQLRILSGCLCLSLQGIFPAQRSNQALSLQAQTYHLSHQGNPMKLPCTVTVKNAPERNLGFYEKVMLGALDSGEASGRPP